MGQKAVVELLTAQGAQVDVNAKYQDGWTLLHAATWRRQKEGAALLLAYGADLNAKTNEGQAAMDIALCLGHRDLVQLLSSAGVKFGLTKNVGKQWTKKRYRPASGPITGGWNGCGTSPTTTEHQRSSAFSVRSFNCAQDACAPTPKQHRRGARRFFREVRRVEQALFADG